MWLTRLFQIGMLQSLETLWVGNNRLSALPVELADLCSLSILGIKNNPLTYVPDIVRQMAAYKVSSLSLPANAQLGVEAMNWADPHRKAMCRLRCRARRPGGLVAQEHHPL